MMRSMFSGVSGLRTHQTRMDVIANNISNVNTVGFKASRTTFDEVFSQTITGASAASEATGRGGVNPMQVGLGTNVASVDRVMSRGMAQRTERSLDLMIDGDGFFIVGDVTGTFFTRAGALDLDQEGNLVISSGMRVLGWETVPDPDNPGQFVVQRGPVQPINISGEKQFTPPEATSNISFTGNVDPFASGPVTLTKSFFDSLGNRYVMDVTLTFNRNEGAANSDTWTVVIPGVAFPNDDRNNPVNIAAPGQPITDPPAGFSFNLTFDSNGLPYSIVPGDAPGGAGGGYFNPVPPQLPFTMPTIPLGTPNLVGGATLGGEGNLLALDFSGLTQFGNERVNVRSNTVNGRTAGTLDGLSITPDGVIMGRYSNDEIRPLGQIPIAEFVNPAGLESVGGNLFRATLNSGEFDGLGREGIMRAGVLEMSNVDLSSEFTDMIVTQRGFQASSRLITTADDMIQELVNLKR